MSYSTHHDFRHGGIVIITPGPSRFELRLRVQRAEGEEGVDLVLNIAEARELGQNLVSASEGTH